MNEKVDKNFVGEGIYKENILDYYKNPRTFGEMVNPDIKHKEFNPFCGDEISIYVKVSENCVNDCKFKGVGCAISQSATDMVLEKIKGMKMEDVMKLEKDDVLKLLGIELGPVRLKCALLGLDTLKNALLLLNKNGNTGN